MIDTEDSFSSARCVNCDVQGPLHLFDGKHVSQLKKDGFNIIYYKESDQEKFEIVLPDHKVKSGYRLIVHLENALKE